jgi:hypothetical protein
MPVALLAPAVLLSLLLSTPGGAGEAAATARQGDPVPWSEGVPRSFLAAQADVGTTAHLRAIAGLGRPHWQWAGLIADAWANDAMATGTIGGRAALRFVNLDLHWRTTRAWRRIPMPLAERHTEIATGDGSTQHAWDLDLWGGVPTPGGYVTWEGLATRLLGESRDVHLYDQAVQAIVRAPWAGQVSLGWVAELIGGDLLLGAVVDLTFLGRGDAHRWRAGPQVSWSIGPRWYLRGQVLFTVASPDDLALWPSLGGGLYLGYAWATGEASEPAAARR